MNHVNVESGRLQEQVTLNKYETKQAGFTSMLNNERSRVKYCPDSTQYLTWVSPGPADPLAPVQRASSRPLLGSVIQVQLPLCPVLGSQKKGMFHNTSKSGSSCRKQ